MSWKKSSILVHLIYTNGFVNKVKRKQEQNEVCVRTDFNWPRGTLVYDKEDKKLTEFPKM